MTDTDPAGCGWTDALKLPITEPPSDWSAMPEFARVFREAFQIDITNDLHSLAVTAALE